MSKITIINDAEQAALVTNNAVTAGKFYLKAEGSTNAGDVVIYNGSAWKRFANEYDAPASGGGGGNGGGTPITTFDLDQLTKSEILSITNASEGDAYYATDTEQLYVWNGSNWSVF